MKPRVILVAGGTASGKTSLAQAYARKHGALLLQHDRYYFDVPDPSRHNYDTPEALDTARMVSDLALLREGLPAELPIYHFATHRRLPTVERVQPAALIVVEGILVLADAALRQLADLRVFVHADADLRLCRRLRRDMLERGRTADSVLHQYLGTVRPMHNLHVEPSRRHAELVLSGEDPPDRLLAQLEGAVAALP
jgi:uridine kinase